MDMTDGYKPISDYALIGNLRTVALVGRDGSIDWCCFPEIDGPSVFGAILDLKRGGRFRISVPGAGLGDQHYSGDTNILKTEFHYLGGRLVVTDFMPVFGNIHACGGSVGLPEIHRIVECPAGALEADIEWSPRFNYARVRPEIEGTEEGWLAIGDGDKLSICGIENPEIRDDGFGPVLHSRVKMQKGDKMVIVSRWNSEETKCALEDSFYLMRETAKIWQNWLYLPGMEHSNDWAGEWLPLVMRSALVLKLLSHGDTGAIAAAPTTSLPQAIGTERNWDYRYTWVRDAASAAQALAAIGHENEASEYLDWILRACATRAEGRLKAPAVYGRHGDSVPDEETLPHLEGYRGSRPVHIGNAAAGFFEMDVYGELFMIAHELARRDKLLDPSVTAFLTQTADHVCETWVQPDWGIWEIRSEPKHYTHSKVMAWVALDRAVRLSEEYGFPGPVVKWKGVRARIRDAVLNNGYDESVGSFVQSFGSKELDAANLRIPLVEFLPFEDVKVQNTIDMTLRELAEDGFVYRYLNEDGLPPEDGAFGLCTFWLIHSLALSRRLDQARDFLYKAACSSNHAGLFSEAIDVETGGFRGNFPHASDHIALINSAVYLAYAEGRELPEPSPMGTPAHRRPVRR